MSALAKGIFSRRAHVASAPLVFISIPIVALFQYPAHMINQAGHLDAGILVNEIFAVLAVPLIFIYALRLSRRQLLPFKPIGMTSALLLIGFMIGADILIDFITKASEFILPLPEAFQQQLNTIMHAPDAKAVALKIAVLCIVPAVCEEIYFRGFIQRSLDAHWGSGWSLAITSVVFAAMHGNIYYFHLYILLGFLFGWISIATGSLWAPILCHVFNNCWTFLNHTSGIEIPLKGVPIYLNALIASGGIILFILFTVLIQGRHMSKSKHAWQR
jgi:sodium transport system permease protein